MWYCNPWGAAIESFTFPPTLGCRSRQRKEQCEKQSGGLITGLRGSEHSDPAPFLGSSFYSSLINAESAEPTGPIAPVALKDVAEEEAYTGPEGVAAMVGKPFYLAALGSPTPQGWNWAKKKPF